MEPGSRGVKLGKRGEGTARGGAIPDQYWAGLRGKSGLTLPLVPEGAEPVWHLFVLQHPHRLTLQQRLTEAGVGTLIHYPVPPHLSGAYADGQWASGDFPIAECLAETVLSLPIGPHLEPEQTRFIIEAGS